MWCTSTPTQSRRSTTLLRRHLVAIRRTALCVCVCVCVCVCLTINESISVQRMQRRRRCSSTRGRCAPKAATGYTIVSCFFLLKRRFSHSHFFLYVLFENQLFFFLLLCVCRSACRLFFCSESEERALWQVAEQSASLQTFARIHVVVARQRANDRCGLSGRCRRSCRRLSMLRASGACLLTPVATVAK